MQSSTSVATARQEPGIRHVWWRQLDHYPNTEAAHEAMVDAEVARMHRDPRTPGLDG